MNYFKKTVLAIALVASFSSSAFAANQGTLGTTSTGDLDITLTINDLIQISGFADMALGTYPGTGDLNGNDDLCVYRNKTPGNYTVTATASEGSFVVRNAQSDSIAYSVFFNDTTGNTGEAAVIYNTALTGQTGANTLSADCTTGGDSAHVHVNVAAAALQAAPSGAYSGTLILTVNPV